VFPHHIRKYNWRVSATIRNEMADLEEMGYIDTHTSRADPSDRATYYVECLMSTTPWSAQKKR
jgi:transcriptional regulator of heat shock response